MYFRRILVQNWKFEEGGGPPSFLKFPILDENPPKIHENYSKNTPRGTREYFWSNFEVFFGARPSPGVMFEYFFRGPPGVFF